MLDNLITEYKQLKKKYDDILPPEIYLVSFSQEIKDDDLYNYFEYINQKNCPFNLNNKIMNIGHLKYNKKHYFIHYDLPKITNWSIDTNHCLIRGCISITHTCIDLCSNHQRLNNIKPYDIASLKHKRNERHLKFLNKQMKKNLNYPKIIKLEKYKLIRIEYDSDVYQFIFNKYF